MLITYCTYRQSLVFPAKPSAKFELSPSFTQMQIGLELNKSSPSNLKVFLQGMMVKANWRSGGGRRARS